MHVFVRPCMLQGNLFFSGTNVLCRVDYRYLICMEKQIMRGISGDACDSSSVLDSSVPKMVRRSSVMRMVLKVKSGDPL